MSFSTDTKEVLSGLVSLRQNALYMVADLRVTKDGTLWTPVSQTRSVDRTTITGGSFLQTAGGDQVSGVEVLVDNYGDAEYRRVYVRLVDTALADATYSLVLVDSSGEQYIPDNIMFDFRSDFEVSLVLNEQLPIATSSQPSVTPSAIAVYNSWTSSDLGTMAVDDGQGGTKSYWKLGELSLSGSPDVSDTEPYTVRVYEQDEDGHEDVVEVIPDTADTSGTGEKWHIVIDQANAGKASRTYDSLVTIVAQDPLGRVTNSQFRLHFLTPVSDSKLNVFSGDFDLFYKVREGSLAGVPAVPDANAPTTTLFTVRTYETFGLMNYATLKVVDSEGADATNFNQSMPTQWLNGGTSASGLDFPLRFSPSATSVFATDKSHQLFDFTNGSLVLRLEEQLGSSFSTFLQGKTEDVQAEVLSATRFDLSVTNLKQGAYTADGFGRYFDVITSAVLADGVDEAPVELKKVVLFTNPSATMTVENQLVYEDASDTDRLVLSSIAVTGGVAYDSGTGDLFEVRVSATDLETYPLEVAPPGDTYDIFSVDRTGAKLSVKLVSEAPAVHSRTSPPVAYSVLVKTNLIKFNADTSVTTADTDEVLGYTCVVNEFNLAYWSRPRFTVTRNVADPFNYSYKSGVPAMHEAAFNEIADTDLFDIALDTNSTPAAGYNYTLVYQAQNLPTGTEYSIEGNSLNVHLKSASKPSSTQVYNFVSSSTDVTNHSISVKEIVFSELGTSETDVTKVKTSKLYDNTTEALIFEEASEAGVTGKGAFNSFMMWIVFYTPVVTLNPAAAADRIVWDDKLVPNAIPDGKSISDYTTVASPSVQHAFGSVNFYYDLAEVTDRNPAAKTRREGFVTNVTTNVNEDTNANTNSSQVMDLYLSHTEWSGYSNNDYSFLPVSVRASLADFAPVSGTDTTDIDSTLHQLFLSVIPIRSFSLVQITSAETGVAIRKIGTNSDIVNNARVLSGKSVENQLALLKFDCNQDVDLFDSTGSMGTEYGVTFTAARVDLTGGVSGDGGSFSTIEEDTGNVFTLYFNNATARATAYTSPKVTYTEGPGAGRTFDVIAGSEDIFVFRELEVVVPSNFFVGTKSVTGGTKTVHGVLNEHATTGVSANLEFRYGYGEYAVSFLEDPTTGTVNGVTYGTGTVTVDETFYGEEAVTKTFSEAIKVTDSTQANLVTSPNAGTTAYAELGAVAASIASNDVLDSDGSAFTDIILDEAGNMPSHSVLAFPPLTRLLSDNTVHEAHVDVTAPANSTVFNKEELFSGGIGFTVDANGTPSVSVAQYTYTITVDSADNRSALLGKSAAGGLHVTGFAGSITVNPDKYKIAVVDDDENSMLLFDNAEVSVVPKLHLYYFRKPSLEFTDPHQILELSDADKRYSLEFTYQGGSKLIVNGKNAFAYRDQVNTEVKHIDDASTDLASQFVGTGGFVDAYQHWDTIVHTGTVVLGANTGVYLNRHFKAIVTVPAFTYAASATRRFVQAAGTLVTASEATLWASSVAEATLFFRQDFDTPMWHLGGYEDNRITNFYDTDAPTDVNTNVVTYAAGVDGRLVNDNSNRAEDPVQKVFLPGVNPFFASSTSISALDSFQLVLLKNNSNLKEPIINLTYSYANNNDNNLPDNVIIEVTDSAQSNSVVALGRRITVGPLFTSPSLSHWEASYRVHVRFSENGEDGYGGTLPDGSWFTLVLYPGIMGLDTSSNPSTPDARNFLVRHTGYIQQLHIAPSDWSTSATSGGRLLSESWLDCSSWRLDYKHIALTDEATVSTSHSLTYHVKLFAMPGNSTTWVDVSQHLESVLNRSTSPNVTASFDTTGGFLRITPNSGVDANTLFLTLLYLPERFFDDNATYTTNSSWDSTNKYKVAIRGGSAVSWVFSPEFYTQRSGVTLPPADSLLQRTVSVDSGSGSLTTRPTRVSVNGTDLGARFEKQLTSVTGSSLSLEIINAYNSLSGDGTVTRIQSAYLPVVPLPGMQYKQVLVNKLIQYDSTKTNSQYTDDIPGNADTLLFFYREPDSSTTELYALRNGVSSRAKTLSSTEFITRTFTTADMGSFVASVVPHGSDVTFKLNDSIFAQAKVNEDGSITVTNPTATDGFESGDVLEFSYNGALTVSFSYSGSSWSHAISDTARFLNLVKAIMEAPTTATVSCRILRSMHAVAFTVASSGSISVNNSYFNITGASKTFSSINTVYDSSNMELKLAVSDSEQLVLTLKVTPTETSVSVKSSTPNNVFEKQGALILLQYGMNDTVAARLRYTDGTWSISTSYSAIQAMLAAKNQIRMVYLLGADASLDPTSLAAVLRDPVPIHEINLQEVEMRDTWIMTLQSGGSDEVQFQFTRSKNNSQALQVAVTDVSSGGNSRLFSGVYKMEIVKGSDRSPMISVINDDATSTWDLTMSLESGGDMFDNHDFFISQIMKGSYFFRIITNLDFSIAGPYTVKLSDLAVYDVVTGVKKSITNNFGDRRFNVGAISVIGTDKIMDLPIELAFTYTDSEGVKKASALYSLTATFNKQLNSYAVTGIASTPASVTYTDASGNPVTHTAYPLTDDPPPPIWLRIHQLSILDFSKNPSGNVPHHWEDLYSGAYDLIDPTEDVFLNRFSVFDPNNVTLSSEVVYLKINGKDIVKKGDLTTSAV